MCTAHRQCKVQSKDQKGKEGVLVLVIFILSYPMSLVCDVVVTASVGGVLLVVSAQSQCPSANMAPVQSFSADVVGAGGRGRRE